MKVRNGFVSNSSSSSFVVFKGALTKIQQEIILNYQDCISILREQNDELKEKFEYYDSDPWKIEEGDDWIFGETSMDNFSMYDFFDHIKVNEEYVSWDEGYIDEPTYSQLEFIKNAHLRQRKEKLENLKNKE